MPTVKLVKQCSICRRTYDGWGCNASPVNSGRCCDPCNWNVVIPARVHGYIMAKEQPK